MKSLTHFKIVFAVAALFIFAGSTSNAAIKIVTVTGVSGVNTPMPYFDNLTIWGSTLGVNSITPKTEIVVTYTSTVAGYPIAFASGDTTTTTTTQPPINDNPATAIVAAGTLATIKIPWLTICKLGEVSDKKCASDDIATFSIGVSTSPSLMVGTESFPITAEVFGPDPATRR